MPSPISRFRKKKRPEGMSTWPSRSGKRRDIEKITDVSVAPAHKPYSQHVTLILSHTNFILRRLFSFFLSSIKFISFFYFEQREQNTKIFRSQERTATWQPEQSERPGREGRCKEWERESTQSAAHSQRPPREPHQT